MSEMVKKIVAERKENEALADVFVMDMDGEMIFDFKSSIKTLHDNGLDWNVAFNRAEQIQKIFYKKKEDGEF